ncbi:MAG: hypothetical protein HONBIEJF_01196 [Fimbriimonadaceae bacterium]|nr:hypothetical protein [Fimbriimonadaceae bacterium]
MSTSREPSDISTTLNQVQEFEFVIDTIRQGIWRVDPFGKILWVNPFLAKWLHSSPQRMIGRYESDFILNRHPAPDVEGGNVSERFEAAFLTENGDKRQAIVISTPTSVEGPDRRDRLEIITDITVEHAVQQQLMSDVRKMAVLAGIDPLTHLLNRRGFETHLENLKRQNGEVPFGLVLLDMNGLKQTNDQFGHEAGDRALQLIAQKLREATRSYDVVARLGGDEFCVLLPGASEAECREVAERLEMSVRGDLPVDGLHFALTTSVGWAHSSTDFEDLLGAADRMMYLRKPDTTRRKA